GAVRWAAGLLPRAATSALVMLVLARHARHAPAQGGQPILGTDLPQLVTVRTTTRLQGLIAVRRRFGTRGRPRDATRHRFPDHVPLILVCGSCHTASSVHVWLARPSPSFADQRWV